METPIEKDFIKTSPKSTAAGRIWVRTYSFVPAWLRNKYFLSFTGFLVWMLFFDRNDMISQHHRTREYQDLLQSKQHYIDQITGVETELDQLKNNPNTLEKYAREKYYMKRDNEELFLLSEPTEKN